MNTKLIDLWLQVRDSYWFVPSLMAAVAIAGSIAMVQVDRHVDSTIPDLAWIFLNQPDGARALLSTVAGSMITVAGVTFSMTLLAVSHATSQIGAHVLVAFMSDRGNQVTLGTFIATFLYCLVTLPTVHNGADGTMGAEQAAFVPHIAIFVALLLALFSVMILIYFIHHVPQSINVSNVIARIGDSLVRSIRRSYPEASSGSDSVRPSAIPADFATGSRTIHAETSGYMRILDDGSLMSTASGHDLLIELLQGPGDFAVEGQSLMRVWPAELLTERVESALRGAFSWGIERTSNQDVLLPAEQLLEVMGKALSPGINDQFTARLCIDQLGRGLAAVFMRVAPEQYRLDDDGALRVITKPHNKLKVADTVFSSMRQYVEGDRIATGYLLDMLERLQGLPGQREFAPWLAAQAASIRKNSRTPSTIAGSTDERA